MMRAYLARLYAKLYPKEMFIGITGSVGKSATVTAAKAVLSKKYKVLTTKTGLDSTQNIPVTLLNLNPSFQKVILEMGLKKKGDMDFYLSLVKPETVIFTKIAYENSENLGGINEILQEKGKLLESQEASGVAILNWDDPISKKLANLCKGSVVYYGTDPSSTLVWAGNIKTENFRTNFELNLGVERVKVNFALLGSHQIYPALAAAALGVIHDVPLTKIKLALESIEPLEHHLQVLTGPNGSIILDDTADSSPASLDGVIDTLLSVPARRRILVLGEMRNLGKYSDQLHRQVAERIYKEKLDFVFLGSGETHIIADELESLGFWDERVEAGLQNSQLVNKLLKLLGKGDVCLIKGSRATRLDEVVLRIAKKT